MVNQQLLDYIKQQTQQGINKEQIKNSLVANGWQAQDIDEAFSLVSNPVNQSSMVRLSAQTISSLPGVTAIFGQAWTIYKQRLGTFLGIMAIPMLIMVVLFDVIIGIGLFGVGGSLLFFVIIFISQTLGHAALLYAVKDSQERIGVLESYRRGWHKIFSYWQVYSLMWLIIVSGFFLLIVPGVIFAVWFSLALFILIAEDQKGMKALQKSKEYVKGKWGGVFWRFFFIGAISLIISLASTLIFSFLKIPFGLEISRFVTGLFLTPLITTYSFLVYSNLKALKGEIVFAPTGSKKAAFIFVGIFGILLIPAIIFLILSLAKKAARDINRVLDINGIQMNLEMCYSELGKYPFSLSELSELGFLMGLRVDPLTKQPYQYQLQPNGIDYKLCAQLELTKTQMCVSQSGKETFN